MAPTHIYGLSHRTAAVAWMALVVMVVGLVLATANPSAYASDSVSPGYSIWNASMRPRVEADPDANAVQLGVRFTSSASGSIFAIRFYKGRENQGAHWGGVYNPTGALVSRTTFSDETDEGWQQATLASPVRVEAGAPYVVSYFAPRGHYADDINSLSPYRPTRTGALTALQGVFTYGGGMPSLTWKQSNYYVDLVFAPDGGSASPTPSPSISATSTSSTTSTTSPSTSPSTSSTSSTTKPPSSTTTSPQPTLTSLTISPTSTSTPPSPSGTSSTVIATPPTATTTMTTAPPSTTTTTSPPSTTTTTAPPVAFPNASTTGAKATLRTLKPGDSGPGWVYDTRGWVTIDGPGTVFEGFIVDTDINVNADNVTVRNIVDTAAGDSLGGIAIRHANNTLIEDVTIGPDASKPRLLVAVKDIYGDATGTIVRRANIFGTSTGVQMDSGLIEDSYIHDLRMQSGDHVNGTTANGGTTLLTIRHNTILNSFSQTDAVSLFQDFGPQANRVIDNNLLAGGGYTIYAGANAGKETLASNIKVTNNRISSRYYPQGGSYGPLAAYYAGNGNSFSGNVWDESGRPVIP